MADLDAWYTTAARHTGRDDWFTPLWVTNKLVATYGRPRLDPCGHPDSPMSQAAHEFWLDNGLTRPCQGGWTFVNPPYSQLKPWVGRWSGFQRVIMLIPARTDTQAWQKHVFPKARHIVFLAGRLKFENKGGPVGTAPFPSALVSFGMDLFPDWPGWRLH